MIEFVLSQIPPCPKKKLGLSHGKAPCDFFGFALAAACTSAAFAAERNEFPMTALSKNFFKKTTPFLFILLFCSVDIAVFWLTVIPHSPQLRVLQIILALASLAGSMLSIKYPKGSIVCLSIFAAIAWIAQLTADPFLMISLAVFHYAERSGKKLIPRAFLMTIILVFAAAMGVKASNNLSLVRNTLLSIGAVTLAWFLGVRTQRIKRDSQNEARMQEQARLSREIHDVLSYSLGTIGVQAGVSAHVEGTSPEELRQTLQRIQATANDGITQLRQLLEKRNRQNPPDSQNRDETPHFDLSGKIAELQQTCEKSGLHMTCQISDNQHVLDSLDVSIQSTIYSIIREAVTNTLTHAQAHTIFAAIDVTDSHVRLRIADDGQGKAAHIKFGRGLTGIQERVRLLDGMLKITDAPQQGIAVDVEIPTLSREG